jgi:hypothetical protein
MCRGSLKVSESITIRVREVGTLAEDYGIPDLRSRLTSAGVALLSDGTRHLVPEDQWLRFVGDAIRAYSPTDDGLGVSEVSDVSGHDSGADWDSSYGAALRYDLRLRSLLDGFTTFMEQRASAIWRQNASTRTYMLPDGRKIGLRLRPTLGLLLYTLRHGGMKMYVHSDADFERALNWVQST